MIRQDDRTPEQKKELTLLVVGTDRCLSGWGQAANGYSYAAWACTPATVGAVESRIERRSDMTRVRVVSADRYHPGRYCAHLHIYVADEHKATAIDWDKEIGK